MQIPLKYFTQEIRKKYNIMDIVDNDYVYIEIRKVMYGLKEAGVSAFNYVMKNLNHMDTIRWSLPLVYGNARLGKQNLYFVWMILVFSITIKMT